MINYFKYAYLFENIEELTVALSFIDVYKRKFRDT